MKTTKYRRRCFDQIEGIVTENKALTEEVDRFRLEAEKVAMERAAQEERMVDLSRRLADKDTEHRSLEEELEHVQILESERKVGEELRTKNRELAVLKANTKKHLEDLVKDRDSWKSKCLQVWKGVGSVFDLIGLELPEDQPRAQILGPVEKAQRA
ncbi:uncharacterized protein LOC110437019 isoform X2 [Sorghum bicolor]|uniref:uncharacterized protein LOC110437019 isoform X2 n=1 Tax=Sorghum bicolor TaxID=4558 RepID=UPI000B425024|nr:uncharacterized protein LOC110437019 isoform X2 [Sorghum bicolor]|eukprot:XP_021320684.1 uncharacterized protein LOC110437019 isoform X2 [Sorghum bicolor]